MDVFLNYLRNMCRKFQGSNSKTLGEDGLLLIKRNNAQMHGNKC